MWPWAHFAVGYLMYSTLVWHSRRRAPADLPVLALLVGTQAPDLVDKPLAWYLTVLPGGRTLAHSVFAIGLVVAVALSTRRYAGSRTWVAFAVGYVTHPLADAVDPLLSGHYADLAFLLWPAIPLPDHGRPDGVGAVVSQTEVSAYFLVQLLLTLLVAAVWYAQGRPGVAVMRGWVRRRIPARWSS